MSSSTAGCCNDNTTPKVCFRLQETLRAQKKSSKRHDCLKPSVLPPGPRMSELSAARRVQSLLPPAVSRACSVVWDCRGPPSPPVYVLALCVLARSGHGPVSERELTAEDKPPSVFDSRTRQEAVPVAASGAGLLLRDRQAGGG